MRVVGLISGTSMDGIDVAATELGLRGSGIELRPLGGKTFPYDAALRRDLEAALPPATTTAETICRLDNEVGRAFAIAAQQAADELAPSADLIVSHGQTLYHWVENGRARGTMQIGQPAWIADTTGLPVVADLRSGDVAAGGQGAPLAALFDVLLLGGTGHTRAALNIGGIANLTVVSSAADPIAYDIGPGNALIDAAVHHLTEGDESFDRLGRSARRGTVQRRLLDRLLADPYYRRSPPKTTGKEHFHLPYLLGAVADTEEVTPDDLVATVTALTAITIADACRAYGVEELVVSGGGVDNIVLMEMLSGELPGVTVRPIDDLGIPSAVKEAYLVAVIGFLSLHGLPGNCPSATGANRPVVLGHLLPGREPLILPPPPTAVPTRLTIAQSP